MTKKEVTELRDMIVKTSLLRKKLLGYKNEADITADDLIDAYLLGAAELTDA